MTGFDNKNLKILIPAILIFLSFNFMLSLVEHEKMFGT